MGGSWQFEAIVGEEHVLVGTVENLGGEPLELGTPQVSTAEFRASPSFAPGTVLSPAETATVEVVFSPVVGGVVEGELRLTVGEGEVSVRLTGDGLAPRWVLTPQEMVFQATRTGCLPNPTIETLSLENVGRAPLIFDGGYEDASGEFMLSTAMPVSLEPGESLPLEVSFIPRAAGTREASFTVVTNDPQTPTGDFIHSGLGVGSTDGVCCELPEEPGSSLPHAPVCGPSPPIQVANPFEVVVEWSWEGLPGYPRVGTIPLAGQLDDDNLDGAIDAFDCPELVVLVARPWPENWDGLAVVLDGCAGTPLEQIDDVDASVSPLLADVDGLPGAEIIVKGVDGAIRAHKPDGSFVWLGASPPEVVPALGAFGLDNGGRITVGGTFLNASDGQVATPTVFQPGRLVVGADNDLDGEVELLNGRGASAESLGVEWITTLSDPDPSWPVVVQADSDPEGELVLVTLDEVYLLDHQGDVLQVVALPSPAMPAWPGVPCAADLDGDGQTEVVVPNGDALLALSLPSLQVIWTAPVNDNGIAGCAAFDFERDGSYEVVYGDMSGIRFFDGTSGAEVASQPRSSGTAYEYPVIVDIDSDGSAEVIAANYGDESTVPAITVLGHLTDGWATGGSHWPAHDFGGTNYGPLGGLPSTAPAFWLSPGTHRARPAEPPMYSVRPEILQVCASGCNQGDQLSLTLRLVNDGPSWTPTTPIVEVGLGEGSGVQTLLAVPAPVGPVPPNSASASFVLTVPVVEVAAGALQVSLGETGLPIGTTMDCTPDDNIAVWTDSVCRVSNE